MEHLIQSKQGAVPWSKGKLRIAEVCFQMPLKNSSEVLLLRNAVRLIIGVGY